MDGRDIGQMESREKSWASAPRPTSERSVGWLRKKPRGTEAHGRQSSRRFGNCRNVGVGSAWGLT